MNVSVVSCGASLMSTPVTLLTRSVENTTPFLSQCVLSTFLPPTQPLRRRNEIIALSCQFYSLLFFLSNLQLGKKHSHAALFKLVNNARGNEYYLMFAYEAGESESDKINITL